MLLKALFKMAVITFDASIRDFANWARLKLQFMATKYTPFSLVLWVTLLRFAVRKIDCHQAHRFQVRIR